MKHTLFISQLLSATLFFSCHLCWNQFGGNTSLMIAAKPAPKKISVWINAFIPEAIANYTFKATQGPYNGKAVIPGPVNSRYCYLTDNRNFSNIVTAGHRMQSLIEIDLESFTLIKHEGHCDPTLELLRIDFSKNCEKTASSGNIKLTGFSVFPNGNKEIYRLC